MFVSELIFLYEAAVVVDSCWLFVVLQIQNLKEGEKYVFRVRAQNKAGVGKTSDVTEPVPALTKPGETDSLLRAEA